MTTAATIGKVTCKKTGQSMRVITPSFKSDDDIKGLLNDCLNYARHNKTTAVAVVMYNEEIGEYYSDFCGKYDTLQAAASLLSYRVTKTWDEHSQ